MADKKHRLWEQLPDEIKEWAEKIFAAGFADGYAHGLYTFGIHPNDPFPIKAEIATHQEGTGAPESENWDDMRVREIADGAKTIG
jgi:hypothetical protein